MRIAGTRSRTGKLLPPRFGLFNYVFESILRTRLYDVTFIPGHGPTSTFGQERKTNAFVSDYALS